jgi:hypothetical protein
MLSLGAIHKKTGEYTHPKFAKKTDQFICPECKKDLILCQGKVRIHHFRHTIDNQPCNHYNNPGESALHKDAKELLKTILHKRIPITIKRKCPECYNYTIEINIDIQDDSTRTHVEFEYRFEYRGYSKVADVAYLHNGKIKYIFEICHTHKTKEEDRPEPWFEIDATTFIKQFGENSINTDNINIHCMRGVLHSSNQNENICNHCFKHYIIETDKIREYINNALGTHGVVVCTCDDEDNADEFDKCDRQNGVHHYSCGISRWPDGISTYAFGRHDEKYKDIEYNKKIIDLFNHQLENIRAVIQGWKGGLYAYIFDKWDYENELSRLKQQSYNTINITKSNYKYEIYYGCCNRGRDVIYDLIQFSKTGISKLGCIEQNKDWIDTSEQIVYLKVHYNDKDKIKNIGGKFDTIKKLWYIRRKLYSQHEDYIKSFCSGELK